MTVEQAVIDRLMADATITGLVGSRVFWMTIPQVVTFPAIRVQLISNPRDQHLRGPDGTTRSRVQVDGYDNVTATGAANVSAIAEAAIAAMVYEPFEDSGSPVSVRVTSGTVEDYRTMYEHNPQESPKVRSMVDFYVWWKRM